MVPDKYCNASLLLKELDLMLYVPDIKTISQGGIRLQDYRKRNGMSKTNTT